MSSPGWTGRSRSVSIVPKPVGVPATEGGELMPDRSLPREEGHQVMGPIQGNATDSPPSDDVWTKLDRIGTLAEQRVPEASGCGRRIVRLNP